jgi:hypothetical protein
MLPACPYTVSQHQIRYAKAIEHLWFVEDIERGGDRPGLCPENVFDFHDGMRLIISKDCGLHSDIVLHASASPKEDSKWTWRLRACRSLRIAMRMWVKAVQARLKKLSGQDWSLELITQENGVVHFFIPLNEEAKKDG